MPRYIDLTGQKFNRLTFLNPVPEMRNRNWELLCECGNTTRAQAGNVTSGHTRSCGCLQIEVRTTHGRSKSPEYEAWANMTGRCRNPKHTGWKYYGARGILVCEEWLGRGGFDVFIAHIGERPHKGLSIDRIDNERGYEPGNVQWATIDQQARNKRSNHWIEINGERKLLRDWAEIYDIDETTIIHRIERGMSEQDAVTVPARWGGRRASKRAA